MPGRSPTHEDAKPESTAFGPEPFRSGTSSAALLNGTSGHALDWD